MTLQAFLLVITGVLLNAMAQLLLKAGTNAVGTIEFSLQSAWPTFVQVISQLPILGGLACYGFSVVVWVMALSRTDVSLAYPMLSIGYIVNALGAYWWLGESLSMQRWAAIGVIFVGVVLLARS